MLPCEQNLIRFYRGTLGKVNVELDSFAILNFLIILSLSVGPALKEFQCIRIGHIHLVLSKNRLKIDLFSIGNGILCRLVTI